MTSRQFFHPFSAKKSNCSLKSALTSFGALLFFSKIHAFLPFGVVQRWLSEALREFLIATGGEVLLGTADGSLKDHFQQRGLRAGNISYPTLVCCRGSSR